MFLGGVFPSKAGSFRPGLGAPSTRGFPVLTSSTPKSFHTSEAPVRIRKLSSGPAHSAFASSSDVVDSLSKLAGPMPLKTPLWSFVRSYSNGPARSRLGKKALSLDHFLQRSRAISLYREIIRGTRRIADPNTRTESRRFARDEFERHRDVTDLGHIRYLISTGKTEWQGMERYVEGM